MSRDDAHIRPDETLEFFSVQLRLATIIEMLIAQRDNTLIQVTKCAHYYKELALHELYPARKHLGSLDLKMRRAVAQRAIELALEDSRMGRSVP
jgi:hypothetical protein